MHSKHGDITSWASIVRCSQITRVWGGRGFGRNHCAPRVTAQAGTVGPSTLRLHLRLRRAHRGPGGYCRHSGNQGTTGRPARAHNAWDDVNTMVDFSTFVTYSVVKGFVKDVEQEVVHQIASKDEEITLLNKKLLRLGNGSLSLYEGREDRKSVV